MRDWLFEIDRHSSDDVCKLIVGNKLDNPSAREVTFEEAKEFADEVQVPVMETSAKSSLHVDTMFDTLSNNMAYLPFFIN